MLVDKQCSRKANTHREQSAGSNFKCSYYNKRTPSNTQRHTDTRGSKGKKTQRHTLKTESMRKKEGTKKLRTINMLNGKLTLFFSLFVVLLLLLCRSTRTPYTCYVRLMFFSCKKGGFFLCVYTFHSRVQFIV